jgi:bifunctional UDP-N-acetylglucosamine pyrophosphorylase/glucosamine-1-phosphate N-acetyltransferase
MARKGGVLSQLDLVIVLAAGEGTRMKSAHPKVLHKVAGATLLEHVVTAVTKLEGKEIRVVIGTAADEVTNELSRVNAKAKTILQEVRRGTGDAVRRALTKDDVGTVLVCAGDTPLITTNTLAEHKKNAAAATVLTTEVPNPTGYGRIVREKNELAKIVEERDANAQEREIIEINTGIYAFDIAKLRGALTELGNGNSQGEEYLTDVIAILKNKGETVSSFEGLDFTEFLGINDRSQLSDVAAIYRDRINEALMLSGVTIVDPASTWIDLSVEIGSDTRIEPGTTISGNSKIGSGAIIGPRTTLIDCKVETGAKIFESHCESSEVGAHAKVGPFTHLRTGTVLAGQVKVGSFVEMKNAQVGTGSKVPHLSYVGDAKIGEETNIGAATIFVNYDGVAKHETKIGDHVRIGSDSMLIAPVSIGDGAYTAAGSVINEDVPAGALGIGRARQVNILGWVLKKRKGTKSAAAAEKKEKGK